LATGTALRPEEREIISRELARDEKVSTRYLGRLLGRDHSGIAREIAKNGGRSLYRAVTAQDRCDAMRARPKSRKLESSARLHDAVNEGLKEKWSPRQIAERLKHDHPDDPELRVSPETIYQCLYLQSRGELRTQLRLALRSGRTRRVPHSRSSQAKGQITGMVNISERPKEAGDRAVPGFWEGDLIIGKGGKSQIATLVERATRFTILVRIPYDRTAERVAGLLARKMETLPEILKNSITWDQGKEMARHADFTVKTGIPVYFCDPHSPWQRGTNENTNGLLRQYFPKGTDLSLHSQEELDRVATELNGRPRETLG
jgi:IS30 family transposase